MSPRSTNTGHLSNKAKRILLFVSTEIITRSTARLANDWLNISLPDEDRLRPTPSFNNNSSFQSQKSSLPNQMLWLNLHASIYEIHHQNVTFVNKQVGFQPPRPWQQTKDFLPNTQHLSVTREPTVTSVILYRIATPSHRNVFQCQTQAIQWTPLNACKNVRLTVFVHAHASPHSRLAEKTTPKAALLTLLQVVLLATRGTAAAVSTVNTRSKSRRRQTRRGHISTRFNAKTAMEVGWRGA